MGGGPARLRGGARLWASLDNPEAAVSRRMGIEDTPAMGVTVQLMVDAAVSGVMFTCNLVSGDPSTVAVNASWGLGLAVVGGEVTPDEYRVSKVTGEVLHRAIGLKRSSTWRRRRRLDVRSSAGRRASTSDGWPSWSRWPGASSATSARTRTSSGRSTARASCSCSSRGRSRCRARARPPASPRWIS